MSEYKRLTERDEFGNADIIGVDSCVLQGDLPFEQFNKVTKALNRLAQFEDGIENGTLVRLPCKIGDIVYDLWKDTNGTFHIEEQTVVAFSIFADDGVDIETGVWYNEYINTYFTREQAEAKLRELKGEK